jgi:hypothetical protein
VGNQSAESSVQQRGMGPAGVATQERFVVNQPALILSRVERRAGVRAEERNREPLLTGLSPSSSVPLTAQRRQMTGQPATVIARWPLANPQSAIPLLGRALTVSRPGTSLGRRAVQIKPYRMPASSHDKQGRNMYVVREHDGANDKVAVLVEDPNAPPLVAIAKGKGKGKARTHDSLQDDDDILFVDPEEDKKHSPDQHSRWTYCSIAQPLDAPAGDSASAAALLDSFIQRALFPPPQPGGGTAPGAGNQSASSAAANSRRDGGANGATAQYWQPRAQVVSIEGFVFALTGGGGSGGGGNTAGVSPDWIVKVGSVGLKGGSASGMAKGCIIEASLLFLSCITPSLPRSGGSQSGSNSSAQD